MGKIILQPTSNVIAKNNFEQTISNNVIIGDLEKDNSIDKEIIKNLYEEFPNGKFKVWGVKNRKDSNTNTEWEKITTGDIVLFSEPGGVFSKAIVSQKYKDYNLAKLLWGLDSDDSTWENIYTLKEFHNFHIDYKIFNSILGYSQSYVIQGFRVLDEKKSNLLYSHLGFFSENYDVTPTKNEFDNIIKELQSEYTLDVKRETYSRKEQKFLRDFLFQEETGKCGICDEIYPIELLVAAHIKKRSLCSNEERKDYKNIVIPMCKLGCDELYERGYIFIDSNGIINKNNSKIITLSVNKYISGVEDKKCYLHNQNNEKYFKFHRENQL